jgi:hypothetical protein
MVATSAGGRFGDELLGLATHRSSAAVPRAFLSDVVEAKPVDRSLRRHSVQVPLKHCAMQHGPIGNCPVRGGAQTPVSRVRPPAMR